VSRRGYLLVTAGGRAIGLAVEGVIEVFTPDAVYPVPSRSPAVRGVTPVRGRLVPLVHLGALLGGPVPAAPGGTAVLVDAPRPIALEVESAEAVIHESLLPPPEGEQLPWAVGVAARAAGPVPVLDLAAVVARLAAAESA
jgi:chemotaxis signal transduction protein